MTEELEQFGTDEWVAREEARRRALAASPIYRIRDAVERADTRLKFLIFFALAASLPLFITNDYHMRVAGAVGLFVMLSLGLNVVVGFTGLLDLGYVAFYGIGAYTYALLSSPQFDQHWPFWLVLPVVIIVTALFGLFLGSTSLRLRGDYLAIATLGFGQIAVLLFLNLDKFNPPFLNLDSPINITGGPNGIIKLDDISILGYTFKSVTSYYYLILAFTALSAFAIYHLDRSRIGRAWRAIREDELAAQTMGVDIARLKLLAYSSGAIVAGIAGALLAAWQGAIFPTNFDVTLLIIMYSMVVLGGAGSIAGVTSGAVILAILPEVLRNPGAARTIFYVALLSGTMLLFRRRKRVGLLLLIGVIVFGLGLKVIGTSLRPEWFVEPEVKASVGGLMSAFLRHGVNRWMLFPKESRTVGNVAFVLTIFILLSALRFKGAIKYLLLVPGLYALAFVWETRLVEEPSITRMIIFGALLVLMMNYRPQGLLGERRVQRL